MIICRQILSATGAFMGSIARFHVLPRGLSHQRCSTYKYMLVELGQSNRNCYGSFILILYTEVNLADQKLFAPERVCMRHIIAVRYLVMLHI